MYLQPYESAVRTTPHLARFAAEGTVFRRHMAEAGQSGIAFAALFSGRQADGHGVFLHPGPLAAEVETIGEVFQGAGWDVATWLEHDMASAELGYAQGAEQTFEKPLRAGDPDFRRILDGLVADPERRAFVMTNFTVTHGPYQLATLERFCGRVSPPRSPLGDDASECEVYERDPETFRRYADFYHRSHAHLSYDFPATRELSAMSDEHLAQLVEVVELLYRANVAWLDELFGALVEEIRAAGLDDESLVVFTADHGETLFRDGTHFKWTHGHQLAPEVLHVPLIVRGPGIPTAASYDAVSRSIDVMPTVASLAGLELDGTDDRLAGRDLVPALRGVALGDTALGGTAPPRLVAYSHTGLIAKPLVETSQRWSLFHALYPRLDPELMWAQARDGDRVVQLRRSLAGDLVPAVFDLARDPDARDNLFQANDPEMRRALADVERYRDGLIAAYRAWEATAAGLDPERQREILDSLGYLGGE